MAAARGVRTSGEGSGGGGGPGAAPIRVLVWQWGRRGAGPRVAAELAASLRRLPGTAVSLSLATGAELLAGPHPPPCALPFRTYRGLSGLLGRVLLAPALLPGLARRVRALRPDLALCAMPGPLDLLMGVALRRAGVPYAVVVHDADPHPGDGFPLQMALQRRLVRHADAAVALSGHVAGRLRDQGLVEGKPLILASHPPLLFGPPPPPPGAHGGPLRVLSFGRLLPYKGLDLLADALALLAPGGGDAVAPGAGEAGRSAPALPELVVRVVGQGPEGEALGRLRRLPFVRVENRWVPEDEVGALLAWADVLVLSHREASQSGVAAAAVAARRWVVATRVGGLPGQLDHEPLAELCEPEAGSIADALARVLGRLAAGPPAPGGEGEGWQGTAALLLGELRRLLPP